MNITAGDEDGWTPAHFAAKNGEVAVLELLRKARACDHGIFMLLYPILYYSILSILRFCFLFFSVLFCSILFHSILCYFYGYT